MEEQIVYKGANRNLVAGLAILVAALAGFALSMSVGPAIAQDVAIDSNDIGGVVTGPNGPEAGVWVIAETKELGTRFIKIVVADDGGRYVLPDLPNAGWKGRGLWTTNGDRTPWHMEGGKGSKPLVVHLQLRPDTLAK